MSLILGAAKNVVNAGETNWLVPRVGEATDDPSLWTHYPDMPQCRLCGAKCKVWTRKFRMALQRDPSNWYARLAAHAHAETLVTSEKSAANIRGFDPELRNLTLVLFKSPQQFWASMSKRPWKKASISGSLNSWTKIYSEFLDNEKYRPEHGVVFLSLEKFQQAPEEGIKRLAERLPLAIDESALSYWNTQQHYMGGNFNVYQKVQGAEPEKLAVHYSQKPVSGDDREFIRTHEATKIFQRLSTLSIM